MPILGQQEEIKEAKMGEDRTLKLDRKVFIEGEIEVLTGIHVGGSSTGLSIGGADKVVVRNPITNRPYIPGSSLKGKMRSLLEKSLGLVKIMSEKKKKKDKEVTEWVGKLCEDPEKDLVQLFGFPAEKGGTSDKYAPTRLTVRDSDLLNEEELARAEETDMYLTELKTEVSIDRLTCKANPRNFERVPAGARFGLSLVLDLYNVDDEDRRKNFTSLIRQALELLEDDYLGGQGSRGYGRVKFHIHSVKERTSEDYKNKSREYRPSKFEEEFEIFMDREKEK